MIRAILIDDEQHCINRLLALLQAEHAGVVEVAATCQSVDEAVVKINALQPDLLFLDVQLGNLTGFDLLRSIPGLNVAVIFTTAYEQFALQAIKFSAIDYLLKPVDKDDLSFSITKLRNELSKQLTASKLDTLLQYADRNDSLPKKLMVSTLTGFELLEVADIIRCESEINYTTIFLKDKKKLLVAKTLKEFEALLSPHDFFRIHNSHLVNLACIKSYHKGKGGSVILNDLTEIEVSTRRKDAFLKKLAEL